MILALGVVSNHTRFFQGISEGFHLILSGNQVIIDTTVRTLRLAVVATAIASMIGLPLGCALGLGRSRSTRALSGLASSATRLPPVSVGLFAYLMVVASSQWGGGPLAGLHWQNEPDSAYFAQTLLVIPIVTALTAAAVRGVPRELLEQARAFGAGRAQAGLLALREARRAVLAGTIVAMGVAISAIGALAIVGASPGNTEVTNKAGDVSAFEQGTLALGAFDGFKQNATGAPGLNPALAPSQSTAVAYATILLGLFVLISVALTWLQQTRGRSWVRRRRG